MVKRGNERRSIGEKSSVGIALAIASALITKVLSFVSQWILALFVAPEELGLAAVAMGIIGIAQLCQVGSGLYVVLVTHKGGLIRIGNDSSYLGLVVSLIVAVALFLSAFPLATFYGDSRIASLVVILALVVPMDAFGLVQTAWLARHLSFGALNNVNLAQSLTRFVTQIILAFLGYGVFAIVLPVLFAGLVKILAIRCLGPHIPGTYPRLTEWPVLFRKSMLVNFNNFLVAITQFAVVLIMSRAMSSADSGLYFWGMSIAGQSAFIVSGALIYVLIPTYAALGDDPKRQMSVFLQTSLSISVLLAPSCMILCILASDLIELCFSKVWMGAAPVVSILSIMYINQPLLAGSQSLLLAKNQHGRLILSNGIMAIFSILAGAFAWLVPSLTLVSFVHAVFVFMGTIAVATIVSDGRSNWKSVVHVVVFPIALCIPAAIVGVITNCCTTNTLARVCLVPMMFLQFYGLTLWLFANELIVDVLARARSCLAQMAQRFVLFTR